jgi:hypothetical protein
MSELVRLGQVREGVFAVRRPRSGIQHRPGSLFVWISGMTSPRSRGYSVRARKLLEIHGKEVSIWQMCRLPGLLVLHRRGPSGHPLCDSRSFLGIFRSACRTEKEIYSTHKAGRPPSAVVGGPLCPWLLWLARRLQGQAGWQGDRMTSWRCPKSHSTGERCNVLEDGRGRSSDSGHCETHGGPGPGARLEARGVCLSPSNALAVISRSHAYVVNLGSWLQASPALGFAHRHSRRCIAAICKTCRKYWKSGSPSRVVGWGNWRDCDRDDGRTGGAGAEYRQQRLHLQCMNTCGDDVTAEIPWAAMAGARLQRTPHESVGVPTRWLRNHDVNQGSARLAARGQRIQSLPANAEQGAVRLGEGESIGAGGKTRPGR